MMKKLVYLTVLAAFSAQGFAQASFDEEVGTELDRLYEQNQADHGGRPQVQVNVQQQLPNRRVAQPQPQYVAQQQPMQMQTMQMGQPQVQVYKQPTTIIEASPLTESNAEKMRRARQETELLTEQKIVEKLESSRMEDEKRRAEMLFGDKLNQQAQQPVVTAAPAPVVVAPQAAVVVPEVANTGMDKEAVRNEVSAALEEMKLKEKKPERQPYFSISGGMGEYLKVDNVRGNYSLGFSVGQTVNEHLQVEGAFQYGNYEVEQISPYYYSLGYPRITNMDVYQASIAAKYLLLSGMVRPLVGGIASYSYRTFNDIQFGYANNEAASHAIDVGLVAGMDVVVSDTLSLGLEYRYMTNLTSKTQSDGPKMGFSQVINNGGTAIEKLNYSNILLNAKMTF